MQLERSESSLRQYLNSLQGRDKVQLIVMDLFETDRRIAKQYFPDATIIADRFHAIRLVNHHFLKAWKLQEEEGRKSRGLLSLMRRHEWHLNEEKHKNLMSYLDGCPVLITVYSVKKS